MMQAPLTRRDFLRRSLVVGGAVIFAPGLLTACGGGGGGGSGSRGLRHSNWPTYIDEETVELFREETGIDLEYIEDINDNGELFAKIQPDLSAGRNPGADIITPTYWMAGRLIGLGFVEELPLDQIPNSKNLVADLVNPSWDPEGRYSLPWQSGMTGVAYNISATGKELRSTNDLFDPAYKGKVGMLTEMRDTLGLVLLGLGKDPATITFDGAAEAFDKIEKAKVDGQIRQFTGNDYMDDLAAGNFVAAVGWSGDISQLALDNPDLRFVIP
ncbi:MAG: spermidine/putrescine ABC transporter substrate-binding protein, partial [Actinomycetota bacterium]